MGFTNGSSAAAADSPAAAGSRLKGQLSFSSRQGSLMSQISEMESEELGGSSPEGAGGGRGFIPGYTMGSGWEDSSPLMTDNMSGMKRPRDTSEPGQVRARPHPVHFHFLVADLRVVSRRLRRIRSVQNGLAAHQFSLTKTSSEMAAMEKILQFQDAVPCRIRAKRGCATHPRSIAERVRATSVVVAFESPGCLYSAAEQLADPVADAGEEDKDQRANQEAAGTRAQHGQGTAPSFCCNLYRSSPRHRQYNSVWLLANLPCELTYLHPALPFPCSKPTLLICWIWLSTTSRTCRRRLRYESVI
jgi:hypothetical protein